MVSLVKDVDEWAVHPSVPNWRLDETAPLFFGYENNPSTPLVWREPIYGIQTVELRGRR